MATRSYSESRKSSNLVCCIPTLLRVTIISGIERREGITLRTVLLVLQSKAFCFAVQEALSECYHVIAAQGPKSGADLLKEQPDILILDLFMPGIDGFCFLKQNLHLLPPTVVLFTTLINPQILLTASDLGVNAVFRKPCSISAMLKQLEQI